jgi:hypothetical protein
VQIIGLLAITGIFILLGLVRVGAAYRGVWLKRLPALLLGVVAALELARGGTWVGIGAAVLAALLWVGGSSQVQPKTASPAPSPPDPRDIEARAILGVGPTATASEIRAAHRAQMAQAHPDRGGSHAQAARINAARDRLLRR